MNLQNLNPFGSCLTANKMKISELQSETLENHIRNEKLLLIRGLPAATRDEFFSLCNRMPQMSTLSWSFGPVMEMKESQDPQNYLFSRERVPFHWDGAFYQVPDLLAFYCVEAPTAGAGGDTLFTNTEKILEDATANELTLWMKTELKYTTEKRAHYGGSFQGPLIQRHPRSKQNILRFAEAVNTDLNPVSLEVLGLEESQSSELIMGLTQKIYDSKYCYQHQWQVGDLLFVDNHSLIHGRTAFEKNCPRHLRRIQLLREKN